ncbi:MAG TPA: NAD(+) diphosphatase [Thermohalobaculum sp.]|nr:NAD(+) diphosphatase [Thermohalobaculum sp.]
MPLSPSLTDRVVFSAGGDALDRASHLRADAGRLLDDGGLVLPLCEGRVLIDLEAAGPRLGWRGARDAGLEAAAGPPPFLGLLDGRARFCADLGLDGTVARQAFAPAKFIDLRSIAGELAPPEAAAAAAARAVLGWHATHPCCARCGAATGVVDAGWRRRCPACGAFHFPRTDPVVIMLILDGEDVLLGRQSAWPEGLYSLLAGFMEPGETIEEAVRRETREEAAIEVGEVRYLGCQPWPFPTTLMIGCLGRALGREITRDPAELEDARWVGRDEMARVLAGAHAEMRPARVDAIARTILEAWVAGEVG